MWGEKRLQIFKDGRESPPDLSMFPAKFGPSWACFISTREPELGLNAQEILKKLKKNIILIKIHFVNIFNTDITYIFKIL